MNGLVKRRYEMLTRVRDFGVKHTQLFPTNSSAQAAFAIVTAEVGRLDALNLTERGASRAARATRVLEGRTRLVNALVRAKNTARVLVKTIPDGSAWISAAIWARAVSQARAASLPNAWVRLAALPNFSAKNGIIASTTRASQGVVA